MKGNIAYFLIQLKMGFSRLKKCHDFINGSGPIGLSLAIELHSPRIHTLVRISLGGNGIRLLSTDSAPR